MTIDTIKEENGFESIWSIYDVNPNRMEHLVAIHGNVKIAYTCGWGTPQGPVEVENPTYMDLWKMAEKMIVDSGDLHHVFIEDFIKDDDGVYYIMTGS